MEKPKKSIPVSLASSVVVCEKLLYHESNHTKGAFNVKRIEAGYRYHRKRAFFARPARFLLNLTLSALIVSALFLLIKLA
jgi:hypothetical protein